MHQTAKMGLNAMTERFWIGLNSREQGLVVEALGALASLRNHDVADIEALAFKLSRSAPYPEITIGIRSGQVQWMRGNPFPIRICDYDAPSDDALSDIDEQGEPCDIWWEPADGGRMAR